MRQFVVIGHDAPTTADVPLDALASEAGRFDLLARSVLAGLLTSHGVREDARVHLVLDDALTVSVDGATVRNLHPDERSTAALLRSAIEARDDAIGHQPAEPSPGLAVRRMGLAATLDRLADDGALLALHEDGSDASAVAPPPDPILVLSDHRDFADADLAALDDRGADRLSLGPTALHADQAITVANHWLDTDGWRRF